MEPINDVNCGWLHGVNYGSQFEQIKGLHTADFVIIGAGITGLSAARQLGKLKPDNKIILVDAQICGEGASSRNSGYLVESTLNDGFVSNKKLEGYREKTELYRYGIRSVKSFIKEHQVDCDWNECGKYYASSNITDKKRLQEFSKTLKSININHEILNELDLKNRLGTSFYKTSIFTNGDVMLNPAKLTKSMVKALPSNIQVYENSKLVKWNRDNKIINCFFENASIKTSNIIFCTNGFLKSLNVSTNYSFPLLLTASMTRPLTDDEFNYIGRPKEWGVLSVRPMGATVRLTTDRRILIRNTAEVSSSSTLTSEKIQERKLLHQNGIIKRFPSLPRNIIDSTWSGIACRSGNAAQIFQKRNNNIFIAGCYNGSGLGLGTLFGEQIANKACGYETEEIKLIEKNKKPNWLPPEPFLSLGIRLRLMRDRLKAKSDT
tara:strand:+ start:190 stop:1494 length:1305 start_codon:yes stop_codon:yes gene_type:complete